MDFPLNTGIAPSDLFIEQAQEALSCHYGGANIRIDGPISVRDNSRIFHATINSAPPIEAAIKHCLVPHTGTPDVLAATEQFVALQRVNDALAGTDKRYRSPSPLFLDTTQAFFAMSWVAGASLTRKMHRATVFIDGPSWFEDVGAWMGHFHSAGLAERRPAPLEERLAVIDRLCTTAMTDPAFGSAQVLLKRAATSMKDVQVEVAWLHGDCKTDNFILDNGKVYGIDISLIYENPVEYDLAQFLNNLSLRLYSPQSIYLRAMMTTLERAFWRGYRSTGPSVSHTYLNWLRLTFALPFWHATIRQQQSTLRKWVMNRMFAKLAKELSVEIT